MARSTLRFVPLLAALISLVLALAPTMSAADDGDSDPPDRVATGLETSNDLLARVGHAVPGFGGAWVEGDSHAGEDEVLHLWLTKPDDQPSRKVQELLVEILGERFDQDDVKIHIADYSWAELMEVFEAVASTSLPGLGYFGIREQVNRVVIGLEDPQRQGREAEKQLHQMGVPEDAIIIEEGEPLEFLLDKRRRPLVGGLQVQHEQPGLLSGPGRCTLGLPAREGANLNHNGFITAGHCSYQWGGGADGRDHWQPLLLPLVDSVGFELLDPPWIPEGDPECPLTMPTSGPCRYSDANFVWTDNAGVGVRVGHIALPLFNTQWDGLTTVRITGHQFPTPGIRVAKVGRTTGVTSGRVEDSCFTFFVDNDVHGKARLLCQAVARMDRAPQPGDSGAPVYRVTNTPDVMDVFAAGIVSGRVPSAPTRMVFSAIDFVRGELGAAGGGGSERIQVCAPGWVC